MPTSLAVLIVFLSLSPWCLVCRLQVRIYFGKGITNVLNHIRNTLNMRQKLFLGICSWWVSWLFVSAEYFSSYSFNSLTSSGPPTVQRFRTDSLSVIPTMPPSSFKIAFSRSWTWSLAYDEILCLVFCVTKLPFWNSAYIAGQVNWISSKSLTCIVIQRA